jgi:flagellar biosynthetic protein FliR
VTLSDVLVGQVFAVLLVFARLGAALLLFPGFGESQLDPRLRLWLGLFTSALVAVALGDRLPGPPPEAAAFAALVGTEVLVGLAIGALVRLALAALQVAGAIVALQSGLAAASFFDPSEATQGTVPGALLSTVFLALLVASDGHHLLLERVVAGYSGLPPGRLPDAEDLLALAARLGGAAIATGLGIAAPVLVASFLANVALGLLARLVPTLQVLFVALPLQLLLALSALGLALGSGVVAALRFLDGSSSWLDG